MLAGAHTALSLITVIPAGHPELTGRRVAAALGWLWLPGLVLGGAVTAAVWALSQAGAPSLAVGAVGVAVAAIGSRGMHIDGMADVADGLGCYGPPERAREVMKQGSVGAFAVITLVVVVVAQAAAIAAIAQAEHWWLIPGAFVCSRIAATLLCALPLAPAPGSGFGTLVAGNASKGAAGAGLIAICLLGGAATLGPTPVWFVAVPPLAIGAALLFARHCVRRFGGLNGDVLGAVIELTATVMLVAGATA